MKASQAPVTALNPPLPNEVVLSLVRRHVPNAREVTFVDESGRKGRAYFVDDDVVLKTHRPNRLRGRVIEEFETSLEKEFFFLQQMAGDGFLPSPKPLGYGREEWVEYVCMSRVPGVNLRQANLTLEQKQASLRHLGRVLRRIHSLPLAPFLRSGLFPKDGRPPAFRIKLQQLLDQIASAVDRLPDEWHIGLSARNIAARTMAATPNSPERAVLHSNPAGEHVYIDPETSQLLGLIDFADAYIGHPALDLRPWREPEDGRAVLMGYCEAEPVSADFLAMWRVGLILGELAGLLRRREPPSRAQDNLMRLLRDLEEQRAL